MYKNPNQAQLYKHPDQKTNDFLNKQNPSLTFLTIHASKKETP